jgi:hypothetical protein
LADTLIPLDIPPGIFRNGTPYQARGRWHDSNLVRFYSGTIEPIGGWRSAQTDSGVDVAALTGVPRGAIAWRGLSGGVYVAFGTTSKLYVLATGTLYDITPVGFVAGRVDTSSATGAYGAGSYGGGSYGIGSTTTALLDADVWMLDTFGDYLIAISTSDGKPYIWTGNVSAQAVAIDITAATGGSATAASMVVTPEKFLMALGTSNQRRVSWANQAGYTVWGPLVTNSAGGYDLATDGRIMAGQRTKSETLIWTDVDVHAARYVGGLAIYRFDQVGSQCGLLSRKAKAIVDTTAFWMGKNNFFVYDGFTRSLESEVRDYVFGDFNHAQAAKVWAQSIAEFGEIWWFYPSGGSNEVDRYVVYNYRENHWTIGQMSRTAGVDAGAVQYPIMLDSAGRVYEHEILQNRPASADTQPGVDILTEGDDFLVTEDSAFFITTEQTSPYLESGPVQIGEGDILMALQRLVPDEKTLGDVRAFIYTALYPTSAETLNGPYDLANPTSIRVTARQVRLRLEEVRPTDWRVGIIRFGVRGSSRR